MRTEDENTGRVESERWNNLAGSIWFRRKRRLFFEFRLNTKMNWKRPFASNSTKRLRRRVFPRSISTEEELHLISMLFQAFRRRFININVRENCIYVDGGSPWKWSRGRKIYAASGLYSKLTNALSFSLIFPVIFRGCVIRFRTRRCRANIGLSCGPLILDKYFFQTNANDKHADREK